MSVITGTSSFGGVSFQITNNQFGLPDRGFTAQYQKEHIPYSDDAVVQVGGSDTDDLVFDAILNTADLAALGALKGTAGVLSILGMGTVTALFARMSGPKRYVNGYVIAALTFVVY